MVTPPLYLLVGKEEFLKKEFISELRRSLFPKSQNLEFNFQAFHAEEDTVASFTDFVRTAPFLSERRLAVLQAIEALADEDKEKLLALADSFPPSSVLVLVSGESSVKKDSFLKKLSEKGKLIACHPPFDRELPQWVEARVKKLGGVIERAATDLLIERSGKALAGLSSAIEQLVLYIHPRKSIAPADIERLLGRSVQTDVFFLAEVLLEKNAASSLRMITEILRNGTRGYEILGVLAAQWERWKKVKQLLDQGASAPEIGAETKIHPFFLEKTIAQARRITRERFETTLKRLAVCDEAIKTGVLSQDLALEMLVLEICLERKPVLAS